MAKSEVYADAGTYAVLVRDEYRDGLRQSNRVPRERNWVARYLEREKKWQDVVLGLADYDEAALREVINLVREVVLPDLNEQMLNNVNEEENERLRTAFEAHMEFLKRAWAELNIEIAESGGDGRQELSSPN